MTNEMTSQSTPEAGAEKVAVRRDKIPYGEQMQIVRKRLWASPTEIAEEFNLSKGAVIRCLNRNKDVFERFKQEVQDEELAAAVAEAAVRRATSPPAREV